MQRFKAVDALIAHHKPENILRTSEGWKPGKYAFVIIDHTDKAGEIEFCYECVKGSDIIVFDRFYEVKGKSLDPEQGCNELMRKLPDNMVLPGTDEVEDAGKTVRCTMVPISAWPWERKFKVQTRNCVDHDLINANIRYSYHLIPNWIAPCASHDRTAVLVSAGPSIEKHLDEIRDYISRPGQLLVTVKHSHDRLIELGLIPWACVLLDPRSHVRDFIATPHKDVIYFVASMCHPTTVERLREAGAKMWGYHAAVGAGEDKTISKMTNSREDLVSGGSTSATRGIMLLHALGFRKMELFAFDSCYWEPQDHTLKTPLGHQKYVEYESHGRKFESDLELVAQAQNFEDMLKEINKTGMIDMNVHGDGLIPHIWHAVREIRPSFEDLFGG